MDAFIHIASITAFSWMQAWEITQEYTLTFVVPFLGRCWPPAGLPCPATGWNLSLCKIIESPYALKTQSEEHLTSAP